MEPDDGGSPITSYDLQYKRTVDSIWTEISDQTDLSETVTGLNAGTSYDFQVRATNDVGDSAWSATAQATTQAAPDLMPSLAAVADQDVLTGVAVNFELPLATGGDGPLTYTATPLPAGLSFNDSTRRVTGTPTTVQTVTTTYRVQDFDGDADSVDFDWNVRNQLTLADLDTSGLDVEAAALLEASDGGAVGDTPYADSDNNGSDSPLDGEMGIGPDNTVISLIRRQSTTILRLNDRNNPATFHIGNYFSASGDGNDLTVRLQTLADGLVTFTVASALAGTAIRHRTVHAAH